jgi:branched-chain amino acid transport system substrate-binding protein
MKKTRALCFLGVLLLLFGNLVLAGYGSAQTAKPEELKVGMISVLTGPGSYWGLAFLRGAELAFGDINKAGGVMVGGKRYTFKFWAEDDKYKPEEAVLVANKLIFTDKVKFIFGPLSSASCLAVGTVCEKNKVFNIADSYTPELTMPGKNLYTVRTQGFIPKLQSGAMVSKFKELYPNLKTIAPIYPDDATGQSANAVAKSYLVSAGYQIVEEVPYPRGTKEQRPIVTKALAKKPDSIWLMSTPPEDMCIQVKEARLMDFKGPIWSTGDVDPKFLLEIAGVTASEGVVSAYFDPIGAGAPPELVEYGNRVLKAYPGAWQPSYEVFYTAAHMLKRAMEIANSIDPTAVRDVFLKEDIEWHTIFGPGFMKGRDLLRPQLFAIFKSGKPLNISAYPAGYPEAKKKK